MLLPQFFAPFHTLSSERGSFADGEKPRCGLFFPGCWLCQNVAWSWLGQSGIVGAALGLCSAHPIYKYSGQAGPCLLAAGRDRAAGCSHLPLFFCRNSHFLDEQLGLMILEVFSKLFLESRSAIHSKKAAVICCRSLSLLLQLCPPPEQSQLIWGALESGYGQKDCLSHGSHLP